ncbi:MAG TPA: hypothetical protein P5308_09410, partial [Syntrophales bacterium]|nr:hypothetical protein [Syntrophales bacterium]
MSLDPLGINLDPLDLNATFRKKIVRPPEGVDPAISATMGTAEETDRPMWVKVADFLTGHFPDYRNVKPEVQTVDGKLQVNVPESAEVPFLQSPEMAVGAGVAGAVKAAGGLAAKVIKGVEESAGYLTGGATDIAKAGVKGAAKIARNIDPLNLEAMVKGGRIGDLPKYAEGSAINLEKLDTTQDVKQLLNSLTKKIEGEIGKKRVSWEETEKLANELGWDTKELIRQHKKKGGFTSAEHFAARQLHLNAIEDLNNTLRNIPADPLKRTDDMRLALLDKINNYLEVAKTTSRVATEAGRSLNIYRKMIAENPEFAADAYRRKMIESMMDSMGGRELTDEMIRELQKVDFKDPKAVRELIQKYYKASVPDMIYEAWINGLLSAPPTHFANIIGNSLTMATKIPESAVSRMLKGKSPIGELRAETYGALQGIMDGVRAAVKAYKTGMPSDMFSKLEMTHMNAIPGKLGENIRIPTRALTAADEFFKSVAYRTELHRQAYLAAEKEGLKGDKLRNRIAEILNSPDSATFKMIHDKAHEDALYRTFNKPLGEAGRL